MEQYFLCTVNIIKHKTIKMKLLLVILLLSSSFIFSQEVKGNKKLELDNSPASSAGLIERAYARKEIDLNKRVLYLAYYLYDNSKLPDKYKSNETEKCGTWIASIIFNNFPKLNEVTKKTVSALRYPPH